MGNAPLNKIDYDESNNVIFFKDVMILKHLKEYYQDELTSFCDLNLVTYEIHCDLHRSYIEVDGYGEDFEGDIENFRQLVEKIVDQIKNDITVHSYTCNSDELNSIRQLILTDPDYQFCEIMVKEPNGKAVNMMLEDRSIPLVLDEYFINDRFQVKIVKMKDPQDFGFQTLDVFQMNMESNLICLDSFGYQLAQSYPSINFAIQGNQKGITQAEIPYFGKKVQLFFENSKSAAEIETNCRQFLKQFHHAKSKSYRQIGITVHPKYGCQQLNEYLGFLSSILPSEDSYLSSPSEIHIIVTEETERIVANYSTDYFSKKLWKKTVEIEQVSWQYQQLHSNSNTPFISFSKSETEEIEQAYQLGKDLVIVGILNNPNDIQNVNEMNVNLAEFYEENVQQNSISPMFLSEIQGSTEMWWTNNLQSMEQIIYEKPLQLAFDLCLNIQQDVFKYHQGKNDNQLMSRIVILSLGELTIKDQATGATKRIQRVITKSIAESQTSKNLSTIRIQHRSQLDDDEEDQDVASNYSSGIQLQNNLQFRGTGTEVDKFKKWMDKIRGSEWVEHMITFEQALSKNNIKYLSEIAGANNLTIKIGVQPSDLVIKGHYETINRLRSTFIKGGNTKFDDETSVPDDWEPQTQDVQVFDCSLQSQEGLRITALVRKSIPNAAIRKLQRIQNKSLWKNYLFERKKLENKGDATALWLFHGTRTLSPSLIYSGTEEGFDFRMSNQGNYGRGSYFHDMASYSYSFGHRSGNSMQMFCALVLVGKEYPSRPDNLLIVPPYLEGSSSVRYDSIRSNNQIGKNEHIVHNNAKAYPYYLITLN